MKHLITNQEWITYIVVDFRKLANQVSKEQDKVTSKVNKVVNNVMNYVGAASGAHGSKVNPPPPPSEEDKSKRRIRQAINKAEKSSLLFGMDLGEVPTINKETLARKPTTDLHRKAKKGAGEAKYTDKQAVMATISKQRQNEASILASFSISKRSEPCLFYTLERLKHSELCLFHKLERWK